MDNPFSGLLRSRKFWLMLVDVLGSLILYFAVKYLNPSLAEDVKMVLAGLQPVIIALIGSIAFEDFARNWPGPTP